MSPVCLPPVTTINGATRSWYSVAAWSTLARGVDDVHGLPGLDAELLEDGTDVEVLAALPWTRFDVLDDGIEDLARALGLLEAHPRCRVDRERVLLDEQEIHLLHQRAEG